MKTINQDQLNKMIRQHIAWDKREGGKQLVLSDMVLDGTNLYFPIHHQFNSIILTNVKLINFNLKSIGFSKCSFNYSTFENCEITHTRFTECILNHSSFIECNIWQSEFNRIMSYDITVQDSKINTVDFYNTFFSGWSMKNTVFIDNDLNDIKYDMWVALSKSPGISTDSKNN